MEIVICTIFPEIFNGFLTTGLIGKAVENNLLKCHLLDIRDYADNKHRKVDDVPYGGGAGMVMTPQPTAFCLEAARKLVENPLIIYLTPQGELFNQKKAVSLYQFDRPLVLLNGRYEGIDERIIKNYVDLEISIGDYVLNGGEVASMVLIETVSRLIPNMLGNSDSLDEESHAGNLLEYPQYTRPRIFQGKSVPEVLLSGHHAKIKQWRHQRSLERTKNRRPDLFTRYSNSDNKQ
ncbi:MAG: tRNA (guanosine(37)-N1)-methyltransferase TrmD [Deltaproteobacteria bacterium]|jgi:tRNA (guanine37-N1)-methyltransferase|nr:tRNA (guanosine(37)-N1)-methyltransferase TrmD [Deltaproteobacteria bacterium]